MKELKVRLEIVTPLFLGGADPRGEPELRAPSFRGALRFWFRALLGGVLGNDTKRIFEEESKVFGSTESSSSLTVRVKADDLRKKLFSELAEWDENTRKYRRSGIAYLFFSAREEKKKREPERKAFDANQTFWLSVSYHSQLEEAYASLWLLTHLGGLGSRSRRGGGNLQVLELKTAEEVTKELPKLTVNAKTPEELRDELAQGTKLLRQWAAKRFSGSLNPKFDGQPIFAVLHPDYCRIWVVNKVFYAWDEALNEFGLKMQSFRRRCQFDYEKVKAVVEGTGDELQPVERAAFGLPIVFYYRSLDLSATLEGSEHGRRASPLVLRVAKLGNEKYALILIQFINPLLPHNEHLKLRCKKYEKIMLQPDDMVVNKFIEHLENKLAPLLNVNYKGDQNALEI